MEKTARSGGMRWLHRILAVVASLGLILAGLITSFEIAAYGSWSFYEEEYRKYDVQYALDMEMDDIMTVTRYMMSYLRGGEEELSIDVKVEGEVQDFFNEQDRFHMGEVQNLFLGGLALRRGAVIVLLLCVAVLVLTKGDWKRLLPRIYQITMGVFLAVVLVGALLLSQDFNRYFVIFHHIFFDNDLWIFDPATDYMIRMLPEGFFYDMTMRIGTFFLVFLVGTFLICAGWRKLVSVSDKKNDKKDK